MSSSEGTGSPRHAILLFCTSASILAYEILLMRLLSISYWYHFAYMVISMALLGFGGAGSILSLSLDRMRSRAEEWMVLLAGATAVSFPLAFSLAQKVGLDPLRLVWQNTEWVFMLITYLVMAIPFLLGGGIVAMILSCAGERTHLMYAADLLGAGLGAVAILPALYLGPPWGLVPVLSAILLFGACWCCGPVGRPRRAIGSVLVSALLAGASYLTMPPVPMVHNTKALPMILAFPDARVETRRFGPLGVIDVVGSSLIRHVPGLSLTFGLEEEGVPFIPEQKAILWDGDAPSPITRFTGDPRELEHLDYTSMALPYHVRSPQRLLVLGAGGGTDVLLGLRHRAGHIVSLEANEQIIELLLGPYASYCGNLLTRPEVILERGDARQFLHSTQARFDLIQLSLLDSFGSAAGGLQSAAESYLYTKEAFCLYLAHLTDSGIIGITRWLKLPPRDSLRVFSTAMAALRESGIKEHPERHLLFIRSWKTTTILVSKTPFSREEIRRAVAFCEKRGFDTAYYGGMTGDQANRYDIQAEPYYFLGASALAGPEAESFLRDYVFDVSPTTDDRPYFSHFFRWDKAPALLRHLQREWLPMMELGYLFVLATLGQAVLASAILILLPLVFLGRVRQGPSRIGTKPKMADILGTLLYFGGIGLGFMFLEMALLSRFTLLLSHPIYSAAVVLSSVLVFAGLGSMSLRRFRVNRTPSVWVPVAIISCWVALHAMTGDRLFQVGLGWPFAGRLALSILLLSVPSFFLGWPFPSGLRLMTSRLPGLVPWAWGVNACASVIGAVLGKCLSVTLGFRMLMFLACALYAISLVAFRILRKGV